MPKDQPNIRMEPERLARLGRLRREIILKKRLLRGEVRRPWRTVCMLAAFALAMIVGRFLPEPVAPEPVVAQFSVRMIGPKTTPTEASPAAKPAEPAPLPRETKTETPQETARVAVPAEAAKATAPSPRPRQQEKLAQAALGIGGKPRPGATTGGGGTPAEATALAVRRPARALASSATPLGRTSPGGTGSSASNTLARAPAEPEPFTFFGQPLDLEEGGIIFVLDRSGSMSMASPPYTDSLGRTVADGSKLQCVQAEFEKTLERLPSDCSFNVVLFGDGAAVWRPMPVPASPAQKASALSYVSSFQPHGSTVTGQAVLAALNGASRHRIVLLSDGHPTATGNKQSTDDEMERHLAMVRRANAAGVTIDCFGFGMDRTGRAFLTRLAAENGGVYVEINQRTY